MTSNAPYDLSLVYNLIFFTSKGIAMTFKIVKLSVVLLALFSLIGCAGFGVSSRSPVPGIYNSHFLDRFPENKQAIIVYKPYEVKGSKRDFEKSIWSRGLSKERALWSKDITEEYVVSPIIPGEYDLVRLVDGSSYIGATKLVYLTGGDRYLAKAKISVAAGDVIYIGDYGVSLTSAVDPNAGFFKRISQSNRYFISLELKDNFSKAQAYIESRYPQLSSRLKKQLIKLVPVKSK